MTINNILKDFNILSNQLIDITGYIGRVIDFGRIFLTHITDDTGSIQVTFLRKAEPAFYPIKGNLVRVIGKLTLNKKGMPNIDAKETILI